MNVNSESNSRNLFKIKARNLCLYEYNMEGYVFRPHPLLNSAAAPTIITGNDVVTADNDENNVIAGLAPPDFCVDVL